MPTFLLRTNWFFQLSTGTIIPMEAFHNFTDDNDTLSQYLRRPTLNLASMDRLIGDIEALRVKKKLINKVRSQSNVKASAAVKFWARSDVVAPYCAYTVTYALMAKGYDTATEASKSKMRAKYDSQTYEEEEKQRLHINAQVRECRRSCRSKDSERPGHQADEGRVKHVSKSY